MSQGCGRPVEWHYGLYYDKVRMIPCGTEYDEYGHSILCDKCKTKYLEQYPQGWRYYPGDVCPHGVYVGGCGVDWMCGRCESGEE